MGIALWLKVFINVWQTQPIRKTLVNCPHAYGLIIYALLAGINDFLVLAYIGEYMFYCELYLLCIILPLT